MGHDSQNEVAGPAERDILKARAEGEGINRIARELGTGSSLVRRVIEENV